MKRRVHWVLFSLALRLESVYSCMQACVCLLYRRTDRLTVNPANICMICSILPYESNISQGQRKVTDRKWWPVWINRTNGTLKKRWHISVILTTPLSNMTISNPTRGRNVLNIKICLKCSYSVETKLILIWALLCVVLLGGGGVLLQDPQFRNICDRFEDLNCLGVCVSKWMLYVCPLMDWWPVQALFLTLTQPLLG